MPYAEGRIFHDADAHFMETPDWLASHADPSLRERLGRLHLSGVPESRIDRFMDKLRAQQADPDYRAEDQAQIMLRKNWNATGSFLKEDRSQALDLLGFSTQLIFNTFLNSQLLDAERSGDLDFAYGMARAHNRSMLDFCGVDRRLLSTCYVPLCDFERAEAMAREALEAGADALLVASACPATHSPSHLRLDPVWAQAQEAGVPIVFHVGGGGELLDPKYFENGLPVPPDFHGGAENFRSVDYMAIPYPVMQTVATLILDGVLERFPRLMFGVIEQGASWVPGWMRQLDSAHAAFHRLEERLQKLSLLPSEYVKRQLRVTPYPAENVGWIIEQAGEEVCLFSSDYPHVEGGRNPLRRFEASMEGLSERARQRFYCDNFAELMGSRLPSPA
ncbi:MAG: amidohydrolase [Myxococcales bacterium]|nr:amidohydrolase [Myxococcales bacterium]